MAPGNNATTPNTTIAEATFKQLFGYRGRRDRSTFLIAEFARALGLVACYGLYRWGGLVVAATLVPAAV